MKKYLFDKIEICRNCVVFHTSREATLIEALSLHHKDYGYNAPLLAMPTRHADAWNNNRVFFAENLEQFLKLLSKTSFCGKDYFIVNSDNEEKTFEELLKEFAKMVNKQTELNKEEVEKFYTEAYKIRNRAKNIEKLLNNNPSEFNK
ncbi:MAG: hypothetical protein J6T74_08040 [Clostridia bacterium]|nr:hypothetical protein [Clostridia bacterium]